MMDLSEVNLEVKTKKITVRNIKLQKILADLRKEYSEMLKRLAK